MSRNFGLIKNDSSRRERRVFPRFPYCFLTFKSFEHNNSHIFEIKDIFHEGMALGLKDGDHYYHEGDFISGIIHWPDSQVEICGVVKWVAPPLVGMAFAKDIKNKKNITQFLSIKNMVKGLKPLHHPLLGLELLPSLKYWLRSDGPIEIFIWQHPTGDFSCFQIIIFHNFIEWEDGHGIKTGWGLSKKDLETPLISEDEFIFEIDEYIDDLKVTMALELIFLLTPDLLPEEVIQFLELKLS